MFAYRKNYWRVVFEDDAAAAADKAAADKAVADKAGMMSKADVDALLSKERATQQATTKKALEELELLKSKATMTEQERTDLEKRIDTLSKTIQTKEEIAKAEKDKLEKELKAKDEAALKERDFWKNRFTQSTIETAITTAAAKHKAYNPTQVIALLKPVTQLTEKLDEGGKPTGQLIPTATLETVDKDGKPVTLSLSVDEAMEKMKEMTEYQNLFNADGSGGTGTFNRKGGQKPDAKTLAKDPAAYREARKSGKLTY